jgi:hypothetical protein
MVILVKNQSQEGKKKKKKELEKNKLAAMDGAAQGGVDVSSACRGTTFTLDDTTGPHAVSKC